VGYPIPKIDFDGNGTSDILWRKSDGTQIAIWNIQGSQIINGGFLQGAPDDSNGNPTNWFPDLGDFNGDNKTDIYWTDRANGRKAIWIMNGPNIVNGGFLQSNPRPEEDVGSWGDSLADFNGDGKSDIYWRNNITRENAIWIMDGPNIVNGGFLLDSPFGEDFFSQWESKFADFNGDGKTDFLWENTFSGDKAIWIMDGPNIVNGGFLPKVPGVNQPL
jgi:hypothetical protein